MTQPTFDNLEARRFFARQNQALDCSYPGCTEPGQWHTDPALCDRHEIICRAVALRSKPAWGGQMRLVLDSEINVELKRIRPDAPGVTQEELRHYLDKFREVRGG